MQASTALHICTWYHVSRNIPIGRRLFEDATLFDSISKSLEQVEDILKSKKTSNDEKATELEERIKTQQSTLDNILGSFKEMVQSIEGTDMSTNNTDITNLLAETEFNTTLFNTYAKYMIENFSRDETSLRMAMVQIQLKTMYHINILTNQRMYTDTNTNRIQRTSPFQTIGQYMNHVMKIMFTFIPDEMAFSLYIQSIGLDVTNTSLFAAIKHVLDIKYTNRVSRYIWYDIIFTYLLQNVFELEVGASMDETVQTIESVSRGFIEVLSTNINVLNQVKLEFTDQQYKFEIKCLTGDAAKDQNDKTDGFCKVLYCYMYFLSQVDGILQNIKNIVMLVTGTETLELLKDKQVTINGTNMSYIEAKKNAIQPILQAIKDFCNSNGIKRKDSLIDNLANIDEDEVLKQAELIVGIQVKLDKNKDYKYKDLSKTQKVLQANFYNAINDKINEYVTFFKNIQNPESKNNNNEILFQTVQEYVLDSGYIPIVSTLPIISVLNNINKFIHSLVCTLHTKLQIRICDFLRLAVESAVPDTSDVVNQFEKYLQNISYLNNQILAAFTAYEKNTSDISIFQELLQNEKAIRDATISASTLNLELELSKIKRLDCTSSGIPVVFQKIGFEYVQQDDVVDET